MKLIAIRQNFQYKMICGLISFCVLFHNYQYFSQVPVYVKLLVPDDIYQFGSTFHLYMFHYSYGFLPRALWNSVCLGLYKCFQLCGIHVSQVSFVFVFWWIFSTVCLIYLFWLYRKFRPYIEKQSELGLLLYDVFCVFGMWHLSYTQFMYHTNTDLPIICLLSVCLICVQKQKWLWVFVTCILMCLTHEGVFFFGLPLVTSFILCVNLNANEIQKRKECLYSVLILGIGFGFLMYFCILFPKLYDGEMLYQKMSIEFWSLFDYVLPEYRIIYPAVVELLLGDTMNFMTNNVVMMGDKVFSNMIVFVGINIVNALYVICLIPLLVCVKQIIRNEIINDTTIFLKNCFSTYILYAGFIWMVLLMITKTDQGRWWFFVWIYYGVICGYLLLRDQVKDLQIKHKRIYSISMVLLYLLLMFPSDRVFITYFWHNVMKAVLVGLDYIWMG